ncbi:MAG: hypothetical protein E3J87_06375 [Candidatus Cloacimonadota bacterium]|nr:MAG: hypothetical protein E3J87_06375 [Candidatus Cloacimonadota bacterium]
MLNYNVMMKNKETLKEEIIKIIKETIKEQFIEKDIELIDLELKGNEKKRFLRVFINNKKDGITLNDCEHLSKSLSVMLDINDPIRTEYTLEVSSPGGRKRKIF